MFIEMIKKKNKLFLLFVIFLKVLSNLGSTEKYPGYPLPDVAASINSKSQVLKTSKMLSEVGWGADMSPKPHKITSKLQN